MPWCWPPGLVGSSHWTLTSYFLQFQRWKALRLWKLNPRTQLWARKKWTWMKILCPVLGPRPPTWHFPGGSDGKESACNAGDLVSIPGSGRPPWEGNGLAIHSSVLAWRIPRTEEPDGLGSMGSQRVRHDWETDIFTPCCLYSFSNIPCCP